MKKLATSLTLTLFIAGIFSGCARLDSTTNFNGLKLSEDQNKQAVSHVTGSVSGLYLLPFIPLITGDPNRADEMINFTFMEDTAGLDGVTGMVTEKAKSDGATSIIDLSATSKKMWLAPTLVLFWSTTQAEGNGIR